MAVTSPTITLSGLARRLVLDRMLTEGQARDLYAEALQKSVPFVGLVIGKGVLTPLQIAQTASQEFGIPLFDLDSFEIDTPPTDWVSEKLIRQHHALPLFKRGNRLYVGVSDPTNLQGLDEIKFHAGANTEPIIVEDDKLTRLIETAMSSRQSAAFAELEESGLEDLKVEGGEQEPVGTEPDIDETPIVRFVNKMLLDAINSGTSDIHFEPYEKSYRVRFRQDGVLHEVAAPPAALSGRLSARLKVMSRMDIAERRVPQDGRIKMMLSRNKSIDFRVNTCPTLWGEKIVLRILDSSSAMLGIDALGYEPDQSALYLKTLEKPYGMILVTGPTGSGKTVSLYTGVNILNTEDRNICTAEDPVEINLPGINQVNINTKVGLTFAGALRAFLRQDPDVILVGEIRDLETAEIAIKAAQTGHLVLSTLHTNDAPQTLTRMANMGVPPYNIASSVSLIIAQRLARRLCSNCKRPVDIPKQALIEEGFGEGELDELTIYGPVGCNRCSNGYKGRVGIYQVLPVSEDIGRIIMENGNALQIAEQARRNGVADLRASGLKKVRDGITSLAEINRVTID
jgi:type IV pilus assembly protein PilB